MSVCRRLGTEVKGCWLERGVRYANVIVRKRGLKGAFAQKLNKNRKEKVIEVVLGGS